MRNTSLKRCRESLTLTATYAVKTAIGFGAAACPRPRWLVTGSPRIMLYNPRRIQTAPIGSDSKHNASNSRTRPVAVGKVGVKAELRSPATFHHYVAVRKPPATPSRHCKSWWTAECTPNAEVVTLLMTPSGKSGTYDSPTSTIAPMGTSIAVRVYAVFVFIETRVTDILTTGTTETIVPALSYDELALIHVRTLCLLCSNFYRRKGDYVFTRVCLFVCVSLLTGLLKNYWSNLYEILQIVGHKPRSNSLDFEWPWLKVKVTRC